MEEQIIYGRNAVTEALRAGKAADTVYLLKGAKLGGIAALAKENGAVVKDTGEEKLRTLTGTEKHGGVAAVLCAAEYVEPEELFRIAEERGEPPFLILADEIQDPHNLGAILRTAEAAERGTDGGGIQDFRRRGKLDQGRAGREPHRYDQNAEKARGLGLRRGGGRNALLRSGAERPDRARDRLGGERARAARPGKL